MNGDVVCLDGLELRYRKGHLLAEVLAVPGNRRRPFHIRETDTTTGQSTVLASEITDGQLPLHLSRLRSSGYRWAP